MTGAPGVAGADPGEDDVTEDALLGGALTLLQPRTGHRVGTDAVLLAAFTAARLPADARLADLGAGTGAVGLVLARQYPRCRVTLIERERRLAALARRNVIVNGLEAQIDVVEADLFGSSADRDGAGLSSGAFDLVTTNPPFFEGEGRRASPDALRRAAHDMAGGTLAGWMRAAADLLRPRGILTMIHRADALESCLAAITPRFGSVDLQAVHTAAHRPARRLLISAVKGGRAPLAILPPEILPAARPATLLSEPAEREGTQALPFQATAARRTQSGDLQ